MAALPSDKVTTTLVKNVLGENSNNVGVLCKSLKINKWSKHKPVKFTQDNVDSFPEWWKANDGNCGLTIPQITNLADLDTRIITWEYNPPTGGAAAPFRIGDFRGYYHEAVPPIRTALSGDIEVNKLVGEWHQFDFIINRSMAEQLALSDFNKSPIGDCYVTVQCVSDTHTFFQSANSQSAPTTNIKVKDGGSSIYVRKSDLRDGKVYKLRFFLSSVALNMATISLGTNYIIPSDSANRTGGISMHVSTEALVNFTINGIAPTLDTKIYRPYSDIAYRPGMGQGMKMKTYGDIFVKVTATGKDGNGATLSGSQFRVTAQPSFVDTKSTIGLEGLLYDSTKKKVSSLSVPAGGSVVFYLELSQILARNASGLIMQPEADKNVFSMIDIRQITTSVQVSGLVGSFVGNFQYGSPGFVFNV